MKVYSPLQFLTAITNFFMSPQKKVKKGDRLCRKLTIASCLATLVYNFQILGFQVATNGFLGNYLVPVVTPQTEHVSNWY